MNNTQSANVFDRKILCLQSRFPHSWLDRRRREMIIRVNE